ncbi:MAG: hypothetical protein OEV79_11810 [candidate division WOR-3 bacterium]|nr:hypothetical protein [candidate division WOR-3 bacterium]
MKKTLAIINELKEDGIIENYAIAGGVGAIYYIETILTYDLDIFFTYKTEPKGLEILKPIYQYLTRKGYKKQEGHIVIEGIPVQFFPVYDKLSREAVECARKTKFKGVNTRVLSAEHLLAIMLQVFRPKDKERIIMLLDQAKVDKRRLNGILRRHNLTKRYKQFIKLHGK